VLRRKHAANGSRLNCAKKETRHRQRQQLIQFEELHHRQTHRWQSLWYFTQHLHPLTGKVHRCGSDDAEDDNEECDRLMLEETLPEHQ